VAKHRDSDPKSELDDLKQLIGGEEWFAALKVAKAHRDFLQGEVNRFVREQNLIEAFAALACMQDADKIFRLIQARFKTVTKGE
jgi:hypothetical protein